MRIDGRRPKRISTLVGDSLNWARVPERALVVTFDDGHRGNHRLLPIFRRYGIRPTIYLCSQIVGTQRGYWVNEPLLRTANGL